MKSAFAGLLLCLVCTTSGCWIRISEKGPEGMRANVGRTGVLSRDLAIVRLFESYVACEASMLEKDSKVIARLPKGTTVAIHGTVYRRLPHDKVDYYVCRDQRPGGHKFDLSSDIADAIAFAP